MDFKRHIETAWNLTLANVVSLILMTLVHKRRVPGKTV